MSPIVDDQLFDTDVDVAIERAGRMRAPFLRWLVVGTSFALIVGWAFVAGQGLGRDPRVVRSPLLGKPVPAFELPLLEGGEVTASEFAGEILVVNFWASWCVPCRQEAPELESFSRRWSGRGVNLVGIVYNDEDDSAGEFRDEFGLTFPQALDPDGRAALDFGVYGIPETYVIDPDGIIKAKLVGAVSSATLEQVVGAVVEGQTVTRKNDQYRTSPGGS